jgi:hypothetical protein
MLRALPKRSGPSRPRDRQHRRTVNNAPRSLSRGYLRAWACSDAVHLACISLLPFEPSRCLDSTSESVPPQARWPPRRPGQRQIRSFVCVDRWVASAASEKLSDIDVPGRIGAAMSAGAALYQS